MEGKSESTTPLKLRPSISQVHRDFMSTPLRDSLQPGQLPGMGPASIKKLKTLYPHPKAVLGGYFILGKSEFIQKLVDAGIQQKYATELALALGNKFDNV